MSRNLAMLTRLFLQENEFKAFVEMMRLKASATNRMIDLINKPALPDFDIDINNMLKPLQDTIKTCEFAIERIGVTGANGYTNEYIGTFVNKVVPFHALDDKKMDKHKKGLLQLIDKRKKRRAQMEADEHEAKMMRLKDEIKDE
jgi:selenophosphate synthase